MMSEIIRIGVDIEEIVEFDTPELMSKEFLDLCFTKREINYCNKYKYWASHLAVRFAAKEAAIKALSGFDLTLERNKIEIITSENGRPKLLFHTNDANILKLSSDVSLSHSATSAIAFVLLIKDSISVTRTV